jgi:hypothetical protein
MYVAYKNRLHGDGKVNAGVTTKLSKIKLCNSITGKVFIQHHNIVFKLAYLNEVMYYNVKLWIVSDLYFSFLFMISIHSFR